MFKAPIFIQFVLGILGGIGADLENLVFMKRTADKLFGDQYQWSVLGAGASQMSLATAAATMGGHVRVGLEDSLQISRGQLAESNAQQVRKVRELLESLGHEIATPDEAREILSLSCGREVLTCLCSRLPVEASRPCREGVPGAGDAKIRGLEAGA